MGQRKLFIHEVVLLGARNGELGQVRKRKCFFSASPVGREIVLVTLVCGEGKNIHCLASSFSPKASDWKCRPRGPKQQGLSLPQLTTPRASQACSSGLSDRAFVPLINSAVNLPPPPPLTFVKTTFHEKSQLRRNACWAQATSENRQLHKSL